MAARTGTALLSAAAARRFGTSTASRIVPREVTASHKLTIDGYTPSMMNFRNRSWLSPPFKAAGYKWRILYGPYGCDGDSDQCISFRLQLDPNASQPHIMYPIKVKFSLLDQSGNPVPKFTRAITEYCCLKQHGLYGFGNFITKKDLVDSGCLKDDCFAVRCDITTLKNLKEIDDDDAPVPPSDLSKHLADILWNKRGTDVAIDVGGEETLEAHEWILARSPVLEAELLAAKKDRSSSLRRIEIKGVEPKVFKALLHYMYTDALPAPEKTEEKKGTLAMTRGLLAAAHRFKLERLRTMCAEKLSKHIDLETVVGTLAVAELNGCVALKAACVEFITRPGNLKALMETEGFLATVRANCPSVMWEIVMKQIA